MIKLTGRVFKCEPGYPYKCDYILAISFEEVMRGGLISCINQAYKEHEYRALGHRCHLVEEKDEEDAE